MNAKMPVADLKQQLEVAASSHLATPVEVLNLRRLSGGASAESWWLDLKTSKGTIEAIFRRSSVQSDERMATSVSKAAEAAVQKLAFHAGIPVPEIVFELTPEDALGEGYVMTRLQGESLPQKILRDDAFAHARTLLTIQCADTLAKIHQIPTDSLALTLPSQPALPQLAVLETMYRSFRQDLPVFEYAIRWLRQHAPPIKTLTLVHGDFRNGNLMIGPQGINGVLDWELSHFGDPMEDLGWLCVNSWRFGYSHNPVGGFGQKDELFARYEKAGGTPVDPNTVNYWQAFGTLRWGIICLFQAHTHLSGQQQSIELAAIGRRVSETEIDLLDIIT